MRKQEKSSSFDLCKTKPAVISCGTFLNKGDKQPEGLKSSNAFVVACNSAPLAAHPVVLLQRGVVLVLAAQLLDKQLLAGGLVLVQHALPRIDHPGGGEGGQMNDDSRQRLNTKSKIDSQKVRRESISRSGCPLATSILLLILNESIQMPNYFCGNAVSQCRGCSLRLCAALDAHRVELQASLCETRL